MCDAVVVATTLQAGAAPLATAAVVQQPVKENVTASLQTRKATINQQGQQWCCNIAEDKGNTIVSAGKVVARGRNNSVSHLTEVTSNNMKI